VRGELHAPELDADRTRVRVGEQGLGHTRHALEQHVATHSRGRDQYLDHVILADHHLADLCEHTVAQYVQSILLSTPVTRASAGPHERERSEAEDHERVLPTGRDRADAA